MPLRRGEFSLTLRCLVTLTERESASVQGLF
jgi:hypothetical protein